MPPNLPSKPPLQFAPAAQTDLEGIADFIAQDCRRRNLPLTAADLAELERMLSQSGAGSPQDLQRANEESQGLGLFVR